MKTIIQNLPITGIGSRIIEVAPKAVAANTTLTVLSTVPVPSRGVIVDATIMAYDTSMDAAFYRVSLAAKNYPARKVKATGTLTFTTNGADGDTVTIGSKTYTLQATLTNVNGNVKLGADIEATIANLKAAINLTAGAGTAYATAMTANTSASCTSSDSTTMVITALLYGTAGNSIATTKSSTHYAFGGATLSGGLDAVVAVGSASAVFTAEDDSGWTATLAVNGTDGTIELKATSDGSNVTTFTGYLEVTPLV